MITVDKFILRRPSLKELGVENKVTTILDKDFVEKQKAIGYTIQDGWEDITTIVNWDKAPNLVVGIVAHEDNDKLGLYSAQYICDRLNNEVVSDISGKHKLIISKDSLGVTKLVELLENKNMYEYAYDFIYERKMVLPVAVEPPLTKDKKIKYRKGRVFVPAMLIKEKYYNLLVSDYSEFNESINSKVEEIKSPTSSYNPVFTYIELGLKYLEQNPTAYQEELNKITQEDLDKYDVEDKRRVIGIKLAKNEIRVPME